MAENHPFLHTRCHPRLLALAKREAADRRIPMRAIIEAALSARYDPEHAKAEEILVLKELRSLRNEIRRVDFGNRVLTELTTLTTKNLFSRLPMPTAESKSAGEGFYNALISSVERVFAQNTPLLDKLAVSLLTASDSEFNALAEATERNRTKEPTT